MTDFFLFMRSCYCQSMSQLWHFCTFTKSGQVKWTNFLVILNCSTINDFSASLTIFSNQIWDEQQKISNKFLSEDKIAVRSSFIIWETIFDVDESRGESKKSHKSRSRCCDAFSDALNKLTPLHTNNKNGKKWSEVDSSNFNESKCKTMTSDCHRAQHKTTAVKRVFFSNFLSFLAQFFDEYKSISFASYPSLIIQSPMNFKVSALSFHISSTWKSFFLLVSSVDIVILLYRCRPLVDVEKNEENWRC